MKTQSSNPLTTEPQDLKQLINLCSNRVAQALNHWLPATDAPQAKLHQAMRYSSLAGGKHVRPLLVYATGMAFGVPLANLDAPAIAVELIHVYSLIHDDLPAMDDDDLRRGQPTCHKAFNEASAILAGDALQALAFDILVSDPALTISDNTRLQMIKTLAVASGSLGMAGGQAIDLDMVGQEMTLPALEQMHRLKTGALIAASVRLGALGCANVPLNVLESLDDFALNIGLAFQVQDDILDIEGETAVLGKTQGADIARGKPTYPAILGMKQAKAHLTALHTQAIKALDQLDTDQLDNKLDNKLDIDSKALRWIADYIVARDR